MIITWGIIEGDQVQADGIHNEVGEEARISTSTRLANTVSKHHASRPPSTTCSAFPSKDHCEPEEPSYVIPLNIGKCESVCATSTLEKLPEPTDEWFPFIRGRSPSADPISLNDYQSLPEWVGVHRTDNPLNFVLAEKFNRKKKLTCFAYNVDVPLTRSGFDHFLGKRHFNSIRKQRRVFSKSEDLLKLEEFLNEAIEKRLKLQKETKEKKENEKKMRDYETKKRQDHYRAVCNSKINGINFPFLRGRIHHYTIYTISNIQYTIPFRIYNIQYHFEYTIYRIHHFVHPT